MGKEYLIKFSRKEAYSDDLVKGDLYMNAAGYYHYLEAGQGDPCEGNLYGNSAIYRNLGRPIYCMYTVYDFDIHSDGIHIPNRIIMDFCGSDGWLVLTPYQQFKAVLLQNKNGFEGYAYQFGEVTYKTLSIEDLNDFISSEKMDNLFAKHPFFRYQHEFRIAVGANLPCRYDRMELNGQIAKCIDRSQPYESKTFNIGSLEKIAKKIRIADLQYCDGYYLLGFNPFEQE